MITSEQEKSGLEEVLKQAALRYIEEKSQHLKQ